MINRLKNKSEGFFKSESAYTLAMGLTIVSALLFVGIFWGLWLQGELKLGGYLQLDKASSLGELLGGLIGTGLSFVVVFLLFLTYHAQKEELKATRQELAESRKVNDKQLINSRFFELLTVHRNNVLEFTYKDRVGRNGIKKVYSDLEVVYRFVNKATKSKPDITAYEKYGIAYAIVFFGLKGSKARRLLDNCLLKSSENIKLVALETVELIRGFNANNTVAAISFQKGVMVNKGKEISLYGNQHHLSHYYRHLYQTVKYIDSINEDILTLDDKKLYVKFLRSQLSTHELALFVASLASNLGNAWNKDEANLIEKYSLIKNLPVVFMPELDLAKEFPNINFETE